MIALVPVAWEALIPDRSPNDVRALPRIDLVRRHDHPDRYAVRLGDTCFNCFGRWEFEPRPSERTDHFLARCRFTDLDEATRALEGALRTVGP